MAALPTRGRIVQSWLYMGLTAMHGTGFLFSPLLLAYPLLYFRFAMDLDLPPWLTHSHKQNSENKWSSQWLTLTIPVDKESKWWSTFLPSTESQLVGEHELGGQEGLPHHKQKAGMGLHDLSVPTSDIRHSIQSVQMQLKEMPTKEKLQRMEKWKENHTLFSNPAVQLLQNYLYATCDSVMGFNQSCCQLQNHIWSTTIILNPTCSPDSH